MKNKLITITIAILASLSIKAQNDTTALIVKPSRLPSRNSMTYIISGLIMSPAIPLFTMVENNDKLGKAAFGSISVSSIGLISVGLWKYLGEKPKRKNNFLHYSLMALSGASSAFREELQHHYTHTAVKFGIVNHQWWDPSISWENKWKNGDINQGERYPLSSTLFVTPTDAYHTLGTVNQALNLGCIITFERGKNFKTTVKHAFFSAITYTLFKGLTHSLIKL